MTDTLLTRWRRALAVRLAAAGTGDRGVALLSAIFFMILVAGLSVVLLSAILSQAKPALTAQKNTRTVYSAQAGLQAALGLIRSAADAPDVTGQTYGAPRELPCSLAASVTGDGTGAAYHVVIQYFPSDPTGQSDAWRTANQIACSESGGLSSVPRYAYIVSEGRGAPVAGVDDATYGDRQLAATYKFKVSNDNIPGGMIYNDNSAFCLEAVSATNGSLIRFVPASQCHGTPLQLWVYSTDYQLELASTTVDDAAGLCITGPADLANKTLTQKAKLGPCRAPTNPARWNQLWSWTGDYTWRGQKENIDAGPSDFCLSPEGEGINLQYLYARRGCNGHLTPDAEVGAGAAGAHTHQIVNYKEFGRCADVTSEQIGSSFMISYPCKQDPTGTSRYLLWNHKWYYNEPPEGQTSLGPQHIYVNLHDDVNQKYCLTSPSATGTRDLTFQPCSSSPNQDWVRVFNTGEYAASYLFTDHQGRCMTADPSDLFNSHFSKVRVTGCNGSLAQKWNAPPAYSESEFGNYREIFP